MSLPSAMYVDYHLADVAPLRYDSVIAQGQLAWQCRLNSLNLPWFLAADSMYLDYHVSMVVRCWKQEVAVVD